MKLELFWLSCSFIFFRNAVLLSKLQQLFSRSFFVYLCFGRFSYKCFSLFGSARLQFLHNDLLKGWRDTIFKAPANAGPSFIFLHVHAQCTSSVSRFLFIPSSAGFLIASARFGFRQTFPDSLCHRLGCNSLAWTILRG